MYVAGCDLGLTKSGVVILNSNFEIEEQNLIRVQSKGVEKLVDIEKAFRWIMERYKGEDLNIFIEGYAYGAKYQRESLAELGGVIRRYIYLASLPYWIVPPNSVKTFVTGNGRASKNYMKKCTKEKWGQIFKSDDVCDAYGMARLGMSVMKVVNGHEGYRHLPQNEQEVVKAIITNPDWYKNSSTSKKRQNDKNKRKTKS